MSLDDDLAEFTGQRYQSWPGLPERGERRFAVGRVLIGAGMFVASFAVGFFLVTALFVLLA